MIPALVDIAQDVKALCPEAWFFNYANPMTANCWAIRQATGLPVVGLCHGVFDVSRQLAGFIGAPPSETSTLYAGLNHLTFIFDLRWQGRDAWPLARARLAEERGETVDRTSLGQYFKEMGQVPAKSGFKAADNPFSWSLFETYGAYPSANDRHVTEFFPERFPAGAYYGKQLGVEAFSFEGTIAHGDQVYADMRAQALGEKPLDRRIFEREVGEHEQLLEILKSIEYDQRRIFSANLPNQGAVPNLPAEAILELPAATTATGLRPLFMPDFSPLLAVIINRKLTAAALTVEAALRGDRRLFIEALLADGAVTDPATAAQLADALLTAQKRYLPNFFDL
jgi:alpha-galactosidase